MVRYEPVARPERRYSLEYWFGARKLTLPIGKLLWERRGELEWKMSRISYASRRGRSSTRRVLRGTEGTEIADLASWLGGRLTVTATAPEGTIAATKTARVVKRRRARSRSAARRVSLTSDGCARTNVCRPPLPKPAAGKRAAVPLPASRWACKTTGTTPRGAKPSAGISSVGRRSTRW